MPTHDHWTPASTPWIIAAEDILRTRPLRHGHARLGRAPPPTPLHTNGELHPTIHTILTLYRAAAHLSRRHHNRDTFIPDASTGSISDGASADSGATTCDSRSPHSICIWEGDQLHVFPL